MKAYTKPTVVMCCHMLDWRSLVAISSGDRRRRGGHGVTKVQMWNVE